MRNGKNDGVGFGKPPRSTRFKRGRSGNPAGRPKGSKNLSTVIEKELSDKVTITENGRQKRLSKGEIAIKQLVNKAAGGDPKALQSIWNFYKNSEGSVADASSLTAFDNPEHRLVMADICRRIRAMEALPPEDQAPLPPASKRKSKT